MTINFYPTPFASNLICHSVVETQRRGAFLGDCETKLFPRKIVFGFYEKVLYVSVAIQHGVCGVQEHDGRQSMMQKTMYPFSCFTYFHGGPMKRVALVLAVGLSLVTGLVTPHAQAQIEVVVGTPTTTVWYPIMPYYPATRFQYILLASEIQAAGGFGGMFLKMAFRNSAWYNGTTARAMENFTIRMQNTSLTNLAGGGSTQDLQQFMGRQHLLQQSILPLEPGVNCRILLHHFYGTGRRMC